MKIIWRDLHQRETESERLFILNVPEREGIIIADALNAHAKGNDHYECVTDSYVLYRFRISTKGYFVELSAIWNEWFRARRTMDGSMSILRRDQLIQTLQDKWEPGKPAPVPCGRHYSKPQPVKPRIVVNLGL